MWSGTDSPLALFTWILFFFKKEVKRKVIPLSVMSLWPWSSSIRRANFVLQYFWWRNTPQSTWDPFWPRPTRSLPAARRAGHFLFFFYGHRGGRQTTTWAECHINFDWSCFPPQLTDNNQRRASLIHERSCRGRVGRGEGGGGDALMPQRRIMKQTETFLHSGRRGRRAASADAHESFCDLTQRPKLSYVCWLSLSFKVLVHKNLCFKWCHKKVFTVEIRWKSCFKASKWRIFSAVLVALGTRTSCFLSPGHAGHSALLL